MAYRPKTSNFNRFKTNNNEVNVNKVNLTQGTDKLANNTGSYIPPYLRRKAENRNEQWRNQTDIDSKPFESKARQMDKPRFNNKNNKE